MGYKKRLYSKKKTYVFKTSVTFSFYCPTIGPWFQTNSNKTKPTTSVISPCQSLLKPLTFIRTLLRKKQQILQKKINEWNCSITIKHPKPICFIFMCGHTNQKRTKESTDLSTQFSKKWKLCVLLNFQICR